MTDQNFAQAFLNEFSQLGTDEPIQGSDAVDAICRLEPFARAALDNLPHLLMEAAQVLWEEVDEFSRDIEAAFPDWQTARADYGSGQLRSDCRDAAPALLDAHDIFVEVTGEGTGEFGIAYDWEFAPDFARACLSTQHARPGYALGVDPAYKGWAYDYAQRALAKAQKGTFKHYAGHAFKYLWGVAPGEVECDLDQLFEMRDADAPTMARAALDAVQAFGDDLDLASTDPMMRADYERNNGSIRDMLAKARG